MAKTNGIERLCNVMEHWRTGSLVDWCRGVAYQIEREHQDALNVRIETICELNSEIAQLRADLAAAKRDMTDEAREVVERLRDLGSDASMAGVLIAITGARSGYIASDARDRLIELIEHGGRKDVDVAALRELADELCDGNKWAYGRFEIANRIRKAIEGAPEQSNIVALCKPCRTKRDAAADWVEQQGGIDAVRDYPKMDEFVATLADDLDVGDDVECGDDLRSAISEELDKRLMPKGMAWPRFEGGEKVDFGKRASINGVTVDVDEVSFVGFYGKLESRIAGLDPCANSRLHGPYGPLGERVKLPEPEVLGADGLPIKEGETVYNNYSVRTVSEVHTSANPYGDDFPWVRYTDGEWDLASNITHTPPETQERIDEDKCKEPSEYWGCSEILCDSCPAEINGEKPYFRCSVAMRGIAQGMDIARRQRELDARTMGGE